VDHQHTEAQDEDQEMLRGQPAPQPLPSRAVIRTAMRSAAGRGLFSGSAETRDLLSHGERRQQVQAAWSGPRARPACLPEYACQ
jgi:hypothetical protein